MTPFPDVLRVESAEQLSRIVLTVMYAIIVVVLMGVVNWRKLSSEFSIPRR